MPRLRPGVDQLLVDAAIHLSAAKAALEKLSLEEIPEDRRKDLRNARLNTAGAVGDVRSVRTGSRTERPGPFDIVTGVDFAEVRQRETDE